MGLLDTLTVVSYVALTADLLLQIRRIHHTQSSDDISLPGLTIRSLAVTTILVKLISMRSTILIVGHGMIVAILVLYYFLAMRYYFRSKRTTTPSRGKPRQ